MVQSITRKDFDRAMRDFNNAIEGILSADRHNYEAQVCSFINLIDTNHILKSFLQPYFSIPIEIDQVVPGWDEFNFPNDGNTQIAYMLKVFRKVHDEDFAFLDHIHNAYCEQNINQNYYSFNRVVVQNCYNKLLAKFEDFAEDQFPRTIDQTHAMPTPAITYNHYDIKGNHQSNIVANGTHNLQTVGIGFTDTVIAELMGKHNFAQKQIDEIKDALQVLEKAQSAEKPNTSLLHNAWEKIYHVGGKIALEVAVGYLSKPEIIQSGCSFLMGLL